MEDFHYAISLAQTLYDVTGDTEDLEEIGLIAFKKIGNNRTKLKRAIIELDPHTGRAKLPCDCDPELIEVATYLGPEDWQYSSNIHEFGDI
ncbi:MAG: hypothetical protein HUJ56_03285 [Erysipelotrichaceae bacterium]|nr:hypothetical protein [Erysipelotrichaceae bacterium]